MTRFRTHHLLALAALPPAARATAALAPAALALAAFALVALIARWTPVPPSLESWMLVLLAAALAFTSLAALAWAYARAEAQYLIPVEYSAFLWAALIGAIVFGERLTLTTVAGSVLIVAGCLIAARTDRPIEIP
jgi:S-adenosylmethionine uptake transporter